MVIHSFKLSPFASFVENHLFPGTVQHGIFHRLTGYVTAISPASQSLLTQLASGEQLVLNDELLQEQMQEEFGVLSHNELIVRIEDDLLKPFLDYLLVRPRQNPAVSFQTATGETVVVRTSMLERYYSPALNQLPRVVEETLPPLAGEILLRADGTKTLAHVFYVLGGNSAELSEALAFLTDPERQLVKLAPGDAHLADPFQPFNCVPRTLYVSDWHGFDETNRAKDFHEQGIEDAAWEFDWVEPTVNHAFRFPTAAFGGLSYGARFCDAVFEQISTQGRSNVQPKMLEVGGGTGSFALSFLEHADGRHSLEYHLLDLAPTLFKQQERLLAPYLAPERHYLQDATELTLPHQHFDLIVANEVIADFPVSVVERTRADGELKWSGPGARYVDEFDLAGAGTPDCFLVNSGVFEFVRRAWEHLSDGGILIMTEYGSLNRYPVRSYHLNHDEFSIHLGHVEKCARAIGFECRILSLKEFLSINDEEKFLDGQEERILCLNRVLEKFGESLPYAAISQKEFDSRFKSLADKIKLGGVTFSPLSAAFHYGPTLQQFYAAVLRKPTAA